MHNSNDTKQFNKHIKPHKTNADKSDGNDPYIVEPSLWVCANLMGEGATSILSQMPTLDVLSKCMEASEKTELYFLSTVVFCGANCAKHVKCQK